MRIHRARAIVLAVTLAIPVAAPAPVLAAPPANDEPGTATVASTLPYTDALDVSEATGGAEDQYAWCFWGLEKTVWYAYTFSGPAQIHLDTSGSDFPTALVAFTPGYSVIECGSQELTISTPDFYPTVLIMVGRQPYSTGTNLVLNVENVPPPANDDFDGAVDISAFPFEEYVDPFLATRAADDPVPSCDANTGPTIWFQTTPGAYRMELYAGSDVAAVYTGVRGELAEVVCDSSAWVPISTPAPAATTGGVNLSWDAEAGVTFYVMLVGNERNYVRVNTALTADLLITATRVGPKTGLVTIEGVLTCSKPASFSYVTAYLVQTIGRFTNQGGGWSQLTECSPDGTPWVMVISASNPFVAGKAQLSGEAWVSAGSQSAQVVFDESVTLKGSKP